MSSPELPTLTKDKNFEPPANASVNWLKTSSGNIRYALWESTANTPKGTIVISHGFSEQIEKYYHVINKFLDRGYTVLIHDWRNHGMSAPYLKESADYFAQMDADIKLLMEEVVIDKLPEPRFGVGHSMGGCMICCVAHDHPDWFAGVVLCSPMMGIGILHNFPMLKHIGKGISLIPKAVTEKLTALNQHHRHTSDIIKYENYVAFIKKHKSEIQPEIDVIKWFGHAISRNVAMSSGSWCESIKTPTLMLLAERDTLVDNDSSIAVATKIPTCTLSVIDFALHELFEESEEYQATIWQQIDSFLFKCVNGHQPEVAEEVSIATATAKVAAVETPPLVLKLPKKEK